MSNSCNQTPNLSNTAEIVGNNNRLKLSPLRWNSFVCRIIFNGITREVLIHFSKTIRYCGVEHNSELNFERKA
jgi:hypothetical protein